MHGDDPEDVPTMFSYKQTVVNQERENLWKEREISQSFSIT